MTNEKRREYQKEYRIKNRKKFVEYQGRYRKELRTRILHHYGGNPPKCACCGEFEEKFLGIDHINNDGAEHRKRENYGSISWWLLSKKFPEGFQVLCHNCNGAKGYYGECPHKVLTTKQK